MPYLGVAPNPRENREVDDISSGFNGGTTQFTLQSGGSNVSPGKDTAIIVSLGGVVQNPGTDYTIAASTITFTTAPASGLSFFGVVLAQSIDINTPADGTVTTAKIVNDAVTADKLAHTSVTAGSYTTADITVDAQGRITAAASGTISGAEIADQAVTNAKVNNSAAIAASKIADFVTGNTNNRVLTATGTANSLNGEANLTFDGGNLVSKGDNGITIEATSTNTAGQLTIIGVNNSNNVSAITRINSVSTDSSSAATATTFSNRDSSNNVNEHIRILSDGHVGIGDTSPAELLTLRDATPRIRLEDSDTTNAACQFVGDDANVLIQADTAGVVNDSNISFAIDGGEAMRIDSAGAVRIGHTSFTADTGADELIVGSGNSGANRGISILNHTGADGRICFAQSGDPDAGMIKYSHGSDVMQFFVENNEAMRIDSSGNVRIQEAIAQSTNAKLGVGSSGINPRVFEAHSTNTSFQGITMQSVGSRNTTNGSYRHFQCVINGVADKMRVEDSGNVTNSNNSYGSISDERLKENIVDASSQWDDIKALRIRKFNFKPLTDPDQKTMLGVVAQEAELVCPGLVTSSVTLQEGEEKEYKSFKYSILYMKAIKCLQEAQAKIETLETKVAALEAA